MKVVRLGILRGKIEIKQFSRQKESVIFTLFFPLLLLVVFASVLNKTISSGVTFSQYFLAGLVASGMVNSGFQQLAINIPTERDNGALKRLRGTPMSPISFFIGKAILVFVAMILQIFLLLLFGAPLPVFITPANAIPNTVEQAEPSSTSQVNRSQSAALCGRCK